MMKLIICLLSLTLTIVLFLSCASKDEEVKQSPVADEPTSPVREKITFSGIGEIGIFDPSVTYDVGNGELWMSYSEVLPSPTYPNENEDVIQTRIAFSTNSGSTWTDSGDVVNPFVDVSLGAPFPTNQGTWTNEVSTLVYDIAANSSERWKILSHRYLIHNGNRLFEHSWIEYKTASSVTELKNSTPVKLFAGSAYNSVNDNQGNTATVSPVGGAPQISLNTFHADLNACAAFSEPGLYSSSTDLYLSIFCYEGSNNRLVLLKCSSPCDPTSTGNWSYLGSLLTNTDAINLSLEKFSASDLFELNGAHYLIVTPVSQSPVTNAYNGCMVFKFNDITTGNLDKSPTKTINGTTDTFNGACTFDENAASAGFFLSEVFDILGAKEFQIFKTKVSL